MNHSLTIRHVMSTLRPRTTFLLVSKCHTAPVTSPWCCFSYIFSFVMLQLDLGSGTQFEIQSEELKSLIRGKNTGLDTHYTTE